MVLTQPAHTVSKKGGDCRIQFIFRLTRHPYVNHHHYLVLQTEGIINSSSTINPSTTPNPGKYIMHFLKLRTRFVNLYPEIDNPFHRFERRIRVEKLAHNI